jgi:anti-anti-sigma factor
VTTGAVTKGEQIAMELTSAVLGDVPMVVAKGTLDQASRSPLQSALEKLIAARFNVIFLDVSGVDRVDSTGVLALQAGVRALGRRGWIGLIGPNPDVRVFLENEGLLHHPMIRVFEDRQAARIVCGERAST